MITQTEAKIYTHQDYLDRELASEIRNEYRNGEIVSITGRTPEHNRISGNLYIALSLFSKGKPYETFHLDQRLWIPKANIYTYPGVMVASKPLQRQTGRKDTILNPCLIAEVLSSSTQTYDRIEKFAAYRTIDAFQEYLLVAQNRIYVQHYIKTAANQWMFSEYADPKTILSLNAFEFQIEIAEFYEGIEWDG